MQVSGNGDELLKINLGRNDGRPGVGSKALDATSCGSDTTAPLLPAVLLPSSTIFQASKALHDDQDCSESLLRH